MKHKYMPEDQKKREAMNSLCDVRFLSTLLLRGQPQFVVRHRTNAVIAVILRRNYCYKYYRDT